MSKRASESGKERAREQQSESLPVSVSSSEMVRVSVRECVGFSRGKSLDIRRSAIVIVNYKHGCG